MKTSLVNIAAIIGSGFVAFAQAGALKLGVAVDARGYTPAQQTAVGLMLDMASGTSPRPTQAPDAASVEVRKRQVTQGKNTCGYIDGIAASSLYCNTDAACVYNSVYSKIGCCPQSSTACNIWTTCLDSSRGAQYTTDNGLTMWCGFTDYPRCLTHIYYDAVFSGYTLLGCGATGGSDSVFYTPRSTFGGFTRSSTSTPTAPRLTTTVVFDGSSATSSTTSSATAEPTSGGRSTTNAGAIAGGVVGGLAGIVLIIGAIMLIVRRRASKDDKDAGPGMTSASMAGINGNGNGNGNFLAPNSPAPAYNSGIPMSPSSTAPLVSHPGGKGGGFYDNRASMMQPVPQQQQQQQQVYDPAYDPQRTPSPIAYGQQQMQPHQFVALQPGQYPNSPGSSYGQPQLQQQQTYFNHPQGVSPPGSGPGSPASAGFYGAISPNPTGESGGPQAMMQPSQQHAVAHEMSSQPKRHVTAELDAAHQAKEMAA